MAYLEEKFTYWVVIGEKKTVLKKGKKTGYR